MKKHGLVIYFVFIGFILWIVCTSLAYRFCNPSKTETEIFLHMPKSFMLDFWAENNKFESNRE